MKFEEYPDYEAEGKVPGFRSMRFEDYPEWLQREALELEARERAAFVRRLAKALFILALGAGVWLAAFWGMAAGLIGGR